MTLVEKIARAICRSRYGDEKTWRLFDEAAIEVLLSMREPTESMVEVGSYGGFSSHLDEKDCALDVWQAMIDQAIKEGE